MISSYQHCINIKSVGQVDQLGQFEKTRPIPNISIHGNNNNIDDDNNNNSNQKTRESLSSHT